MNIFSIVRSSVNLLNSRDKKLLMGAIFLQFAINFADVIGVVLVGAIGALGVSYISGAAVPVWVNQITSILGLGERSTQDSIIFVSSAVGCLFIGKSLLSLILLKRVFTFLAKRQIKVSIELATKLTKAPFLWLKRQSSDRLVYATHDGTSSLFMGVIGNAVSLVVDSALLFLIIAVIAVINPVMAVVTFLFFGLLAWFAYKGTKAYSVRIGKEFQESSIKVRESLTTILQGYREISSLKKSEFFLDVFKESRERNAISNSNSMWVQYVPKTSAEVGLVLGAAGLVVFQVLQNSASGGVGMLLVFLASASRMTPALIRIQGSLIGIQNYSASSSITLEVIEKLRDVKVNESITSSATEPDLQGAVEVRLRDVAFRFPDSHTNILESLSMHIQPGKITAIAGPSGSGKTTLVDLAIGLYEPTQGVIQYKDITSPEWKNEPKMNVAYVPQTPYLFPGTLRENIALGFNKDEIDENLLLEVIQNSQLKEFLDGLPHGLDTDLSGISSRVSGGEKQRIALARALFSKPNLLILDESTSALDGKSEKLITDFISTLSGKVTVLVIAHRLASIKHADTVYFLKAGKLKGHGNFNQLIRDVPEFAEQVKLMEVPQPL